MSVLANALRTGTAGAVALALGALGTVGAVAADLDPGKPYDLGRDATPEEVAGWDIDVLPDGTGALVGQGTPAEGEAIFMAQCAVCHGEFGEGVDRYPVLFGGEDTLASRDPVKTPGSYWPYASTLVDYIYRAMPFGQAQTLTPDQAYALTAYLLYINFVLDDEDFVLSNETIGAVEMPNRDGFIRDDRPDAQPETVCMTACDVPTQVVGRARIVDVTPDDDETAGLSLE
ncbi:cytochrome c [Roseospira marina]|uniref:Cytochrome c n=1 Tax=Roseospira marina TaxID=140057 RepID=A0A5M6IAE0_9PROT|nr:cytochrome c [Roseospira marina]KAA5605230.1 cytochrome c [Roseospira marina]MBB4314686.1 cytochrome c [Roseospira marina]MBB5087675.1 cytochrome c [Roseospira marina]